MKKYILSIIVLLVSWSYSHSQDTITAKKEKDVPVFAPFESGMLIDNQTSVIPTAKTLEMLIQHRFGTVENGIKDIYGIYASANIRIGFNYSILDNLMVGYGLTRNKMYSDFQVKYNILEQTRKNTIPIAVTLYGNMAIDGRAKTSFEGTTGEDSAYNFSNRLSYFGQVIIGRKFNDWFSLQGTASFTHYNKVAAGMDHDKIGLGISGRVKFSPQSSVLFQFDGPLQIKGISEQNEFVNPPKPSVGLGYELSTGTHVFQIFISTSNGMIQQDNYMYNQFDYRYISDWMFGFTMTRLWGF